MEALLCMRLMDQIFQQIVAPINFPLNTIFRQIDISLNQRVLNANTGVNHSYKAVFDLLLNSISDMLSSQALGGFFYKDSAGDMEDTRYNGPNFGFIERWKPTRSGGVVTIEAVLKSDFMSQERLILNGVALNIKLFQATDSFRLHTSKDEKYKLVLTSALFKVSGESKPSHDFSSPSGS